jgi:AraC family transcriptional regulator
MYDAMKRMEEVIEYIEANLTGELDFDVILSKVNLSLYEFRRVFSFVVGCPLSEYTRKRKLSLAALEILSEKHPDLLKISEKYGYSNQSSFSRAFSEHHGFSPSACATENARINLFTRPKFEINVAGLQNVPLRIVQSENCFIKGYHGISTLSDTCCCDDVWNGFFESEVSNTLRSDRLYACYHHRGDTVECCIGELADEGEKVEGGRWACFTLNTVDDDVVNEEYGRILYDILPSANLKRDEGRPTVEVFPSDMSQDGFEWEIRIPVC